MVAYTEGWKTDDGMGCVFVLGQPTRSFMRAPVFTREVVALIKLLSCIETKDDVSYLILSDSLAALWPYDRFIPRTNLHRRFLERLATIEQACKPFTLCWIHSNAGVAGNEMAAAAAKLAVQRAVKKPLNAERAERVSFPGQLPF